MIPKIRSILRMFHLGSFINYNFNLKTRCAMPTAACIETTNFCNLKCVMCGYALMKRKKEHMDFKLFKKIIDELSTFKCLKTVELQLWGEPLLDPSIFKKIDYARKRIPYVQLSTNANLLTKEKAKMLIKHHPHDLRISIDAASEEVYNKIRCGGDYNKVIENTKRFLAMKGKGKKPYTRVQLIEMRRNTHEIEKFKKVWENLADQVFIERICSFANLSGNFDKLVINKKGKWPYSCGVPWNRIYIYSNGDVPFCLNDIDGKNLIGNVKKNSIKEIWDSEKAFRIRGSLTKRQNLPKECIACNDWDRNGSYSPKYLINLIKNKLKNIISNKIY